MPAYLLGLFGGLGMTITCEFGTKFLHTCTPALTPSPNSVCSEPALLLFSLAPLPYTAPIDSFSMKLGVSPRPNSRKGSWRGLVEGRVLARVSWLRPILSVVE